MSEAKDLVYARIESKKILESLQNSSCSMRLGRIENIQISFYASAHSTGFYDGLRAMEYLLRTIEPDNKEQVKGLISGLEECLRR